MKKRKNGSIVWHRKDSILGLNLIDFSFPGHYLFEEGTPGKYIYRIELLNNLPDHPKSQAYIKFIEETGAEVVSTYVRWIYFRKKASDAPFELYSDIASKIAHYKRIALLFGTIGFANCLIGSSNILSNLFENKNYYISFFSFANLLLGALLIFFFFKYFKSIRRLKKESILNE